MANPSLTAKSRKILGRKVKKLRKEGLLPANLYGKKIKSQALELSEADFLKIYKQEGETGLIDLKIDSQVHPVLVHNLQIHPVTDEPLHVDFREVSLTEKTTVEVPIEIRGEAPAVEQKRGILIQPLNEVEVEALPADLPDEILVDVSKLTEVGQAITVADLVYDKEKVKALADNSEIVVKINPLEEEEVAPPPAEEVVEGEVPEGEVPVEGAEAVPPEKGKGPSEEAKGPPKGEEPQPTPPPAGEPEGEEGKKK
jgi:large subunit ribosomal protein L25